jgi:L-ascorbate metabolism protein UlaG (beta-lactamase superfamily)
VQTNGGKRAEGELRNTLYVFDYDGLNVVHLGDLRRVPSQTEVEALGNVHIALVPVGGGGGLTPAKAVEVISLLEPGIVIPMHYSLPNDSLHLSPLSKFLKEMGIANIDPQPSLKISASSVPDETRVVVLEYERE